ncbi:MAG: hypothetical protein HDT20_07000 [Oscillibacter sp.]|nr:hypothetical protein [Oscillibacter sp.]
MNDLMQILFDYIIEQRLDTYCLQTKRREYQLEWNMAYQKLWDQLTREQRELLEECDSLTSQTHTAELYAMFLAAFDQSAALLQRHTA